MTPILKDKSITREIPLARCSVHENCNSHQDLRYPGPERRKYNLGTTTPVMLRSGRLRSAQGHVAFAALETRISAMASAESRRMGNGGSVGGAFQPYLDSLRQELQQRDPTLLSIVVALLAVLLTLGKEVAGGFGGFTAGGVPAWTRLVQIADAGRRRRLRGICRGRLTSYTNLPCYLKQRE